MAIPAKAKNNQITTANSKAIYICFSGENQFFNQTAIDVLPFEIQKKYCLTDMVGQNYLDRLPMGVFTVQSYNGAWSMTHYELGEIQDFADEIGYEIPMVWNVSNAPLSAQWAIIECAMKQGEHYLLPTPNANGFVEPLYFKGGQRLHQECLELAEPKMVKPITAFLKCTMASSDFAALKINESRLSEDEIATHRCNLQKFINGKSETPSISFASYMVYAELHSLKDVASIALVSNAGTECVIIMNRQGEVFVGLFIGNDGCNNIIPSELLHITKHAKRVFSIYLSSVFFVKERSTNAKKHLYARLHKDYKFFDLSSIKGDVARMIQESNLAETDEDRRSRFDQIRKNRD